MTSVAVIDYGMGNIGSVCNMLNYIGARYVVSSDHQEIRGCDKIILPGVGNYDLAMQNLAQRDLIALLREQVLDKKIPILGICLGMQLLCNSSEEGAGAGLGFVNADVRRFQTATEAGLKIPHMGWSEVEFVGQNAMSEHLGDRARFYFVHTYRVDCKNDDDVWGVTRYGDEFVSAFVRENIVGVQFHPEKSHKYGIQLFRNFVGTFRA